MNNKAFTISLAMALAAVFMIYSYITSKEQEWAKRYGDEIQVVVAKSDISELDQINETMVDMRTIPKEYADKGAHTKIESVRNLIALVPIKKGEQISFNKVGTLGLRTGLSRQITPGKRAVSIPVNELNAVSKLLKPGDRVDIIVVAEPPGSSGRSNQVGKTLLQDVPVLSVGKFVTSQVHRYDGKDDSGKEAVKNLHESDAYSTITLEVDPPNAQLLAFVTSVSGVNINLSLRNNDDTERVALPPITMNDVLGGEQNRTPVQRNPAAR